jgi:hypothetical protein
VRIGELLFREGAVFASQVEAALRMQSQYGGRLGSNLIELGYVDGDVVARALGRIRKVPAALQKHFDGIDRRAIARFPRKVAEKYGAMPLGYSTTQARTLIVAFVDPSQLAAIDEIQFLVGARVQAAVAPEVRIAKALEEHYGIPPKNGRPMIQIAAGSAGAFGDESLIDRTNGRDAAPPSSSAVGTYGRSVRPPDLTVPPRSDPAPPLSSPIPPPTSHPRSAPPSEPVPSSLPSLLAPAPISATALLQSRSGERPRTDPPADARAGLQTQTYGSTTPSPPSPPPASVRRPSPIGAPVSVEAPPSSAPKSAVRATPTGPPAPLAEADAVRAILTATSRESVAAAIVAHLRGAFAAGVVLVCRNDVAIGWRGFAAVRSPLERQTIESIALPLTQPSILSLVYESGHPFKGAPPEIGDEVHKRLYKALLCRAPREAIVAPVVVGDRALVLVYAQAPEGADVSEAAARALLAVCRAAGMSYARLLEQARDQAR